MLHVFSENEGLLVFQATEMESSWFLQNYGTNKPQNVNDLLNNIMIMIIIIKHNLHGLITLFKY